ncbi:GTPase HflX, partial [Staphylococcus aureus]|nr:GTPase HflX [Staphylococcus aureus]
CDHASNRPASDLPKVFVSSKNDGDKLLVKTLFIDEINRQLTYYDEAIATNNADRLYFLNQHTLVTELKYDEIENVYRITGFKK